MGIFGATSPAPDLAQNVPPSSPMPVYTRLLKEAEKLVPADRFIDISWDEWDALLEERGSLAGSVWPVGRNGVRLRSHVYARPPGQARPVDPALVTQAHDLARSVDAFLRKVSGIL